MLLLFALILFQINAHGQTFELSKATPKAFIHTIDSIVKEGLYLYKLERASWISTDIISNEHNEMQKLIDGYLSYFSNDSIKSIYWDKQQPQKVLLTFAFDTTFNKHKMVITEVGRNPNDKEKFLIQIRQDALKKK